MRKLLKIFIYATILGLLIAVTMVFYYSSSLPDHRELVDYEPVITSRLYAENGNLIAEFAKEKRSFVPGKFIPKHVKDAFIAAEDSNFYDHPGVDLGSIIRATYQNIFRFSKKQRFIGGSTITQQVVKNILLTKERTLSRKIKEAILAVRISKILSKERVLELYLNEIYLGYRSFGVATAALNYFNKSLDDLSIAEAAFLASLPKAPGALDPKKNYDRILARRDWVIGRMFQDGFINIEEKKLAIATPIITRPPLTNKVNNAGSFSEVVRKETIDLVSERSLTEDGLVIHGTLVPKLQNIAVKYLRNGLRSYDRRNGYRGAIANINIMTAGNVLGDNWADLLAAIERPNKLDKNWHLAVVTKIEEDQAIIGFEDKSEGFIKLKALKWVKIPVTIINEETGDSEQTLQKITAIKDVFKLGDVILVQKKQNSLLAEYYLRQIPEINGAVVIMNPHNGAVFAMVGGYNDDSTSFNRAVQAKRQPGSIIKPFTYLAALENGFSPNNIVIDDEVRMKKEDGTDWIPMNYSKKFYGATPIRIGLEKSRNVVTVRLAEMVGLSKVAEIVKRYDISDNPLDNYAMILGADETSLLRVTNAYAMIANGGKKIKPHTIEKIQHKSGKTIYKRDQRLCHNCLIDNEPDISQIKFPNIADTSEYVTDERSAYQMISLLEGVVSRGTAWRARHLRKPIAGKTGTTNDSFDAWFVGFSSDIVVGVWAGFDQPKTLGEHETGSSVALPIFVNIMKKIQVDYDSRPFKVPENIKFSKIDRNTGLVPNATSLNKDIIFEVFKSENFEKFFGQGKDDDEKLNDNTLIY
jgi:penicillin-binding protein 1A